MLEIIILSSIVLQQSEGSTWPVLLEQELGIPMEVGKYKRTWLGQRAQLCSQEEKADETFPALLWVVADL
ncbi:MAG: hypothetical protein WCT05_16180 [Lentisphaeria bacterium]